jgi:hypothetical protein
MPLYVKVLLGLAFGVTIYYFYRVTQNTYYDI